MVRTFLQIASLVLTLVAAFFLARGSIGLSPHLMAELATTKWGGNLQVIDNLAGQQADTRVGFVLLLVAFGLQMVNALWPMRYDDFNIQRGAAAYAVVFCLVVAFGAHFLSKQIAQSAAAKAKGIIDTKLKEAK